MIKEDQINYIKQFDAELIQVLEKKGADYARNDDVLGNFKRLSAVASMLKIDVHTPMGYALFMAVMKIDRIANLLHEGKGPENESLEDSFKDGAGYLKLAYLLAKEENEGSRKIGPRRPE